MTVYIDHHLVNVWKTPDGGRGDDDHLVTLYWGDDVLDVQPEGERTRVTLTGDRVGWVRGSLRTRDRRLLSLAFIDVGQGDACFIETPDGHRLLIDGGENQRAARYLSRRFWHETQAGEPVVFDALIVTHGDADHFAGLAELVLGAADEMREYKKIVLAARRVFHNGLVKRPVTLDGDRRPETDLLGHTVVSGGKRFVTPLVEDPRDVPDLEMNKHFLRWKEALGMLARRGSLIVRRIDSARADELNFLGDVRVEVLGPRVEQVDGGADALRFLTSEDSSAVSAARTINGHSVTLRFTYGNVRLMLAGDLIAEVERALMEEAAAGGRSIEAEVLKVPHHGSSDVDIGFLKAVRPIISVISAGDEDARRDYLHPRANVLGALGNAGRGEDPLVFCTNLSAFDRWVGNAFKAKEVRGKLFPDLDAGPFYARERSVHGIVHVRTDGSALFVSRRGARPTQHEAYAFAVPGDGSVRRLELDRR